MPINVGIYFSAQKASGGLYQYGLSLINALNHKKNPEIDYFFITRQGTDSHKDLLNICNNGKILTLADGTKLSRSCIIFFKILRALGVPIPRYFLGKELKPIHKLNLDLLIFPFPTSIAFSVEIPYIVVIHDMLHFHYPQFFNIFEHLRRSIVYRKSAQCARTVICDSECTRKDIIRYFKVNYDSIKIIPLPLPHYILNLKIKNDKIEEVRKRYLLGFPFIFYPAQFWKHKNHVNLIKAISRINHDGKAEVHLVLVGSKKNAFGETMKAISKMNMEHQVHYLGYVPEEEMPYLYKLSRMLVFASLFDPNAIPIWEAFWIGVPVVSSNVCALPEQVGDAGLLFDPTDIDDMVNKIILLWNNEQLRNQLIEKGLNRVKFFTTENYKESWESIIKEILKR